MRPARRFLDPRRQDAHPARRRGRREVVSGDRRAPRVTCLLLCGCSWFGNVGAQRPPPQRGEHRLRATRPLPTRNRSQAIAQTKPDPSQED
jgi:hypothetical protein